MKGEGRVVKMKVKEQNDAERLLEPAIKEKVLKYAEVDLGVPGYVDTKQESPDQLEVKQKIPAHLETKQEVPEYPDYKHEELESFDIKLETPAVRSKSKHIL